MTSTRADFRVLAVSPGSVEVVVTDPPWGHFDAPAEGLVHLYEGLGRLAAVWLAEGGGLVVLTGAGDDAEEALLSSSGLELVERFPVLVNGRKAAVIHVKRAPAVGGSPQQDKCTPESARVPTRKIGAERVRGREAAGTDKTGLGGRRENLLRRCEELITASALHQ